MTELYSHPDQMLLDHIQGVIRVAKALCEQRNFIGGGDPHFPDLIGIASAFHDFGKATSYFQDYLLRTKRKTVMSRHSLLSSIVGYQLAKMMLMKRGVSPLPDSFFLWVTIKRHHGDLLSFKDELNSFRSEKENLLRQARAVNYDEWNRICSHLLPELPGELDSILPLTEEVIVTWIRGFEKEMAELRRWLRKRDFTLEDYFRFCNLYSVLLDADKNQAALRENVVLDRRDLAADLVLRFKQKETWFPSPLNEWRDKAFNEVDRNICEKEGRIFSIHLPTGMGKTLISFHAALQLREKRKKETGYAPRIIYVLPFLSVIDQNFDVLERVIQMEEGSVDHSVLMKHHSLVEPIYDNADPEHVFGVNESNLLIEGWNSEIVCTTFVQLFQTLLSNRNRVLRRFHRMSHSIILIDEIQAVPHKYWRLVRELLLRLSEESDILLLTATEPRIFEPGDPVLRLCDPLPYFQAMNRVKIVSKLDSFQTVEEFVAGLKVDKDHSYLFIFNTIGSCKKAHELLKEKLDEPIGFLSTHLPPKERLKRIQEIKRGKYRIVVSTQLVEAGVDISFDVVYRDLAPLDSIIQSAGRGNRNGIKPGVVYVVSLWDERRSYASYIYEPVKLDATKVLLSSREWDESDLFSMMEEYFALLKGSTAQDESEYFLNAMKNFFFSGDDLEGDKRPVSQFRLVEETCEKIDVFVEMDEEAQRVWAKYREVKKIQDPLAKREAFLRLKKSLMEYVISIPANVDNRPPKLEEDDLFYFVGSLQLSDYYNSETGFITKGVIPVW
ncbi:CRISPR-associated helicase Cas3' [Thermoactinomyces sp. FSL K6-2592]|jgi:CRISPR-associated endonuclease/helicase Cas3|uniref:CRISPR-associated helicase Cas3' n=1 Tax=Thermoactinomyces sp. FSL K6-2592 TaxID=2975347 RepID=UPI0030F8BD10